MRSQQRRKLRLAEEIFKKHDPLTVQGGQAVYEYVDFAVQAVQAVKLSQADLGLEVFQESLVAFFRNYAGVRVSPECCCELWEELKESGEDEEKV